MSRFKEYDADYVFIPLTIVSYGILAYFIYLFFKNYKSISATDSAKVLMENILKTRRTVKQYVGFNLVFLVISTIIVLFVEFEQDPNVINLTQQAKADGEIFKFYAVFILTTVLFLAAAIGILLFFYWLVYGILLKRLNKNHKELKRLEV